MQQEWLISQYGDGRTTEAGRGGLTAVFMLWKKENIHALWGHDMLLYEMTHKKY